MRGAAVLEVDIHEKVYASATDGSHVVLRDIAFSATVGEVLALLGPSGVGKTTVLRIVLGLDRIFRGRAVLAARRPGVMFQEPRLLPWLTVADNLRLVRVNGLEDADIEDLLRTVALPQAAELLPSALSLGMQRRVALARALAVDPDALILDEPFASLDPALGTALAAKLAARAHRHGTLVLFSTHDLDLALAAATRILVLSGEPATLAAHYAVPAGRSAAVVEQIRQHILEKFTFPRGPAPSGAGAEAAGERHA